MRQRIKSRIQYYAPRIHVSPNVLGLCHPHPDLPIRHPQVPGNWSALEPRREPEAWLSFAWSSPRNRRALATEAWPRFWSCSRSTGAFVTWPKRVSNVISICWFGSRELLPSIIISLLWHHISYNCIAECISQLNQILNKLAFAKTKTINNKTKYWGFFTNWSFNLLQNKRVRK